MFKPSLIISGGQTGADQGGLRAARDLGIPTGGYAPYQFWTEEGPMPWLEETFNLVAAESQWEKSDYSKRTELNVKMADATVIFGRRSPGSNLTELFCQKSGKPFMWIKFPPKRRDHHAFRLWLERTKPDCLNVAGNRESKNPGIGAAVTAFLIGVFSE